MSAPSDPSAPPQRILVSGATGKQGGAVVDALLRRNTVDSVKYHVLALTRGTGGALSGRPNVTVVRGDLDDVPAIFAQPEVSDNLYGVFSVQPAFGKSVTSENEVKQGKALADAAKRVGVKHFVYTGVDRGVHSAAETDLDSPQAMSGIPHWDTKVVIERHIRSLGLPYTFIRPPIFMDGWIDPSINRLMGGLAKGGIRAHVKTQYIASEDIGEVAAAVFEDPERYIGKALSIAGDELTFGELDAGFRATTGSPAPALPSIVGTVATTLIPSARRTDFSYKFFDQKGYKCDITLTRAIWPGTMTLRQYLEKHVKQAA
ncbi:NAD(P)-binding protein [Auricularia subglabra TFB-10046 SS5]|uniref:NAD(P)-binding protein n=1 Tax=Auricularia subglabra (strain TFB-10046 / SS5) TaxID=717982 RepID=J0WVC5_AURST|nr:NAD(P)-binding protein [Auricularia subglabra TFB-10046 SS5]